LAPWPALRREVFAVMMREGLQVGQRWFYKGAKLCLIWPLWHRAFPRAKWVVVRRPAADIVASCLRTPFMRAYSGREGWALWVQQHEDRFEEMGRAGLDLVEVWPDRIVAGRFDRVRAAVEWAGLGWDDAAVRDFVDAKLWSGDHGGRQGNAGASA
jgi:hypothetical protein